MRAVIQRVKEASVTIDGRVVSVIVTVSPPVASGATGFLARTLGDGNILLVVPSQMETRSALSSSRSA